MVKQLKQAEAMGANVQVLVANNVANADVSEMWSADHTVLRVSVLCVLHVFVCISLISQALV